MTTKKTKTDHAKTVAKFVVGVSVGYVTGSIIGNNTNPQKRHHKAERFIGAAVVGGMAAEAAEDWTDRKIDAIVKGWNDMVSEIKTATN